jgi:hypothetical protein
VKAEVEMVKIRTCDGSIAKPCASFIYLGSQIEGSASATPEIRRRIAIAMSEFASMNNIWKTKSLPLKLKGSLYRCLILSILLSNAEVWPIGKGDLKALEGAHFRMLRRLKAEKEDAHISKAELLKDCGLVLIEAYMYEKRMRWIGHAMRRPDHDASKQAVKEALLDKESKWTRLVEQDCKTASAILKILKKERKKKETKKKKKKKKQKNNNKKMKKSEFISEEKLSLIFKSWDRQHGLDHARDQDYKTAEKEGRARRRGEEVKEGGGGVDIINNNSIIGLDTMEMVARDRKSFRSVSWHGWHHNAKS